MKFRKYWQPARLIATVTMLFMIFGAVGPLVQSAGAQIDAEKVFVCKYVGTPGVDERLQEGDNPISVSVNTLPADAEIGSFFADSQGRSYVLEVDTGQPEPSVTLCPPPDTGVTPTPTPTTEPSPTPTTEPSPTPTTEPSPTPTMEPSPTPTMEPSPTPTVEPSPTPTLEPGVTPTITPTVEPTVEPTVTPTHVPTKAPTEAPKVTPVPAKPVTALPNTGTGSSQSDQVLIAVAGLAAVAVIAVGIRKRTEA